MNHELSGPDDLLCTAQELETVLDVLAETVGVPEIDAKRANALVAVAQRLAEILAEAVPS